MKRKEKEVDAYQKELQGVFERLRREMPPFQEADQFLKLIQTYFSLDVGRTSKSKVIVLGSAFPEELIYAFGITPDWILGGSLQTGTWAGQLAPRDADSISRSMLGTLLGMEELTQDALILLPVVSDSIRKLAYLLRRAGVKIHTVDIPPCKGETACRIYERQLDLCVERLSSHTGRGFSLRALRHGAGMAARAYEQLRRFRSLMTVRPELLTASWRMMIGFSYYCAQDLPGWTDMLTRLNDRIENSCICKPDWTKVKVLLMGSPIYFPNYKIPFLLQDVGLTVADQLDYTWNRVDTALPLSAAKRVTLNSLARRFYQGDCSASYAQNNTLQLAVSKLLDRQGMDGVVYCVLKGQIEYDFELEAIERLCGKRRIPVFRLETDYNQQDVEQLRIRMEAFLEMLQQKRMGKEEMAV